MSFHRKRFFLSQKVPFRRYIEFKYKGGIDVSLRVRYRLALKNLTFPVRVRLLAMSRSQLSPATARLMSKCLWSGWNGREELKIYPPPSPAVLWIMNIRERKPRQKKKSMYSVDSHSFYAKTLIFMPYFSDSPLAVSQVETNECKL